MTGFLAKGGSRVSARRPTHFLLLRQEKVSKEKATQLSATPALRYGATCVGEFAGCAVELATRCTQTTTASQMLKHACPAARMPPRKHPATGAYRWGDAPRAFASLGPAQTRRASAPVLGGRAQRRPVSTPLRLGRGAQDSADQGSRCLSEASLARPRRIRAPQVARSAAQGPRRRVAFSLLTFSWRSKRK